MSGPTGDHCPTVIDQLFLLSYAPSILFMQVGFSMLEAGHVRSRNVTSILYKNACNTIFSALAWYLTGWAFAYGDDSPLEPGNRFIGMRQFALSGLPLCKMSMFLIQFTFAATATTIVSGALAERTKLKAYIIYSFLLSGFIYPVVVHWVWSNKQLAWLANNGGQGGFIDFAGSGVVHVVGGAGALVACAVVGPRDDREADPKFAPLKPHSIPHVYLGGSIISIGFLYFIGGGEMEFDDGESANTVARAMVNAVLAMSGAGIAELTYNVLTTKTLSLSGMVNAQMAGLVAACAGADVYEGWAALLMGMIASGSQMMWSKILIRFRIDDTVDAVSVHLGAGIWGIIARPLFERNTGVMYTASTESFYNLAWSIAGIVVITSWVVGITTPVYLAMRYFKILRVPRVDEAAGLDLQMEQAYQISSTMTGIIDTV